MNEFEKVIYQIQRMIETGSKVGVKAVTLTHIDGRFFFQDRRINPQSQNDIFMFSSEELKNGLTSAQWGELKIRLLSVIEKREKGVK